jgi:ketosteroid isomerase-like protein
MSLDNNRRLYRRWLLELWNGDLAVADQVVTPDFVGSWPGRPGLVHGPGELVETIRMSRELFHDLSFAVEDGRFAEYWVISETEHLSAQLQGGQAGAGPGGAGR